jgi:hypothetical protein
MLDGYGVAFPMVVPGAPAGIVMSAGLEKVAALAGEACQRNAPAAQINPASMVA